MNTVIRKRNLPFCTAAALVAASLAAGFSPALAIPPTAAPGSATLVALDVQDGDAGTEILLRASAPFTYTAYDSPDGTYVIDLTGVTAARVAPKSPIGTPAVTEIRVEPAGGKTRVRIERGARGGKVVAFQDAADPRNLRVVVTRESGAARAASAAPTALTFPIDGSAAAAPPTPLPAASARTEAATELRTVEIRPLAGGTVVELRGDGTLEYTSFRLENPERLVVDLPGVMSKVPRKSVPGGPEGVRQVRIAQNRPHPDPVTRVVVDLDGDPATRVVRSGDAVRVYLSAAGEDEVNRIAGTPAEDAPVVMAGAPLESGEAAEIAAEATRDGEIRFDGDSETGFGDTLYETQDAAAASEETARFIEAFQTTVISGQEQPYSGRPISLDLRDAPILDIFRLFHDLTGLNIVVDPSVKTQTITIDVKDVPWDQVLDLILKTHSLGKTLENNVLRIAPTSKLAAEEQERQQLRQQRELSGELLTVVKTLSYARAEDMNATVRRFLSPRGDSIVDARTNTLILKDLKEYIDAVSTLMERLDVQNPQVMIESRIVETAKEYAQAFGVQWGFNYIADPAHGNTTNYSFPHSILVDGNPVAGGGLDNPLDGYAVNLPVPGFQSAIGLSLANILNTFQLDIALMALESKGRARIISAPKVVAQNNEIATIESGTQIPIVSTTATEIDVRYVSASLRLEVTPQITADGTVIMDLIVENNSPSQTVSVGEVPGITTRKAETVILVRDGGTTVIGGIYQVNEGLTQGRTPFLHRIPLLGWLFKNKVTRISNNELLIFLTPRILK